MPTMARYWKWPIGAVAMRHTGCSHRGSCNGGPGRRDPSMKSCATWVFWRCSVTTLSKCALKSSYVAGISFSATLKPRISCFISS